MLSNDEGAGEKRKGDSHFFRFFHLDDLNAIL